MDDYKVANLVFDFARLIQPHPIGIYSKRAIGSRDNINMWSVEHFESLYGGIEAIHTFYEEYSLGTLARLVV
jgi:hypothetical protein